VFLSHQQAFGTTPTACIRFAILSRIETLHSLLEHFYDSQRNENAAQSVKAVPAAGCRRRIGCTPRREGSVRSGRPPGDVSRRRSSSSPSSPSQKPRSAAPLPPRWRTDDAAREAAVPIKQHRCHTATPPVGRRLMEGAATAATIGDTRAEATPRCGRPLGNCAYNDSAGETGPPVSRLPMTEVDQLR
jgi:hypothetical protein